jgi:predicted NBD/HSP70 family sugar kinase
MAEVVLRVRLMSGDQLDVRYEDDDADEDEVIQRVVDTLAEASGVLRTTHGDRLMVLYGRGVAAIEMAPRGAVL